MAVIRKLGDRVEAEHNQFLRDSQRIEDKSATQTTNGSAIPSAVNMDFESLVGRANGTSVAPSPITVTSSTATESKTTSSWDDDVWGSILGDSVRSLSLSLVHTR